MKRIILAALLGALVYYIWQMLGWLAFPLHGPTVHALPNEDSVRDALIAQDLQTGLYVVPFGTNEDMANKESEFYKRHEAGPNVNIFYNQHGHTPMPPSMMAIGFATDFAAAAIVALLLSCVGSCCAGFWKRVGFVTAFGVFLALTAHVAFWNWMRFPTDFVVAFIIDAVVGWFLAGIPIAAIIRPAAAPEPTP